MNEYEEDEKPFYCPYMKNFICRGCFTDYLMDEVPECYYDDIDDMEELSNENRTNT